MFSSFKIELNKACLPDTDLLDEKDKSPRSVYVLCCALYARVCVCACVFTMKTCHLAE